MFINAKQLEENVSYNTEVCIIGGGIAGISIALELKKKGIESCIVESGGIHSDRATMDLYRGENIGIPYTFADGSRSRFLGGSSNCWGGWCAPFDEIDFAKRDWVENSGWPFELNEMVPYYKTAHQLLKLGPFNYDPEFWVKAINHKDVNRMVFPNGRVRDVVSQFSPPAKFGTLYRDELESAKDIRVFLHANVTSINSDEYGTAIKSVKVTTLKGNSFSINATQFVLATGGIENVRLLLTSDDVHKKGLGNEHDLVGRYFMDHPRVIIGNVTFTEKWYHDRFYDVKYNFHQSFVSAKGVCLAGHLALTPEIQAKEKVLNARVCFDSHFLGEAHTGAVSLRRYKDAILKKNTEGFRPVKDLLSIVTNPLPVSSFVLTRFVRPRFLIQHTKISVIIEQEPRFDNYITLSNEKDKLGMRRVKVNWQPGKLEQRTFDKTLRIIADELLSNGYVSKIDIGQPFENNEWPANLLGTWHHMGTTRMSNSPKQGVVDANCKLHGVSNLFLAGSSVFPTSGGNFPTINLTALAVRLADHVAKNAKGKAVNQFTNAQKGLDHRTGHLA